MEPPPPLRSDLKVRELTQRGETTFILKEPDKGSYFRFDAEQYLMLTLFDGKRDGEALLAAFDEASEVYEYDLEGLQELAQSAQSYQLLERNQEELRAAYLEKLRSQRRGRRLQAEGSMLNMRFHLVDPNRLFNNTIDRVRFIWNPVFVKGSFVLMALAIFIGFANGTRFLDDFERVFFYSQQGVWNFFNIWLVALGAIALHEVGHGLTCKHFGGDVDDMGFLLLVFQPCLYCNVNDAWLFENTRHKIYVALAGVWFELILAALAVFIWLLVDVDHPIGRIAFILMTISTASSLFMNLNPLMKFDGYYILSDFLEIPNLRQNAIAWFSYQLKTRIFRLEMERPLESNRREERIYLIYGFLIVAYLTIMLSGIALIGYDFIAQGMGTFGIIAFLIVVLKLVRRLTGSWAATLKEVGMKVLFSTPRRRVTSGIIGALCLFLLFFWSPRVSIVTTGEVTGQALVFHAPESGAITAVGYGMDRMVRALGHHALQESALPHHHAPAEAIDQQRPAGDDPLDPLPTSQRLLFRMEAPELALEISRLEARERGLLLDRQLARMLDDRGGMRRSLIQIDSVSQQIASLRERLTRLDVMVPRGNWQVDGPPPITLEGRYFHRGEPIITLIPAHAREMNVLLPQSDLALVESGNGALIRLLGDPKQIYTGKVHHVTPVAKVDGPNRLFQVRIGLEIPPGSSPPPPGLSGEVRIVGDNRPLWEHLLRPIRSTLRADLWI
ncbi:MAG: HlyD family efflux transporter periplasmic adaptor subunit [Magnetococcales bacterium]|nr:HlyD family efflux transporter periplasmic adaptor subunit [Magnetococcales bacterium]